jgi:lipopolysaccharide heptosyltransferase II
MKILIFALSGIGDALMFTPALKLLRKELPDADIDAVVMIKAAKDLYERNPNINKVIYFDFLHEGFFSSLKFLFSLRRKYDASINVYPSNRKEYNVINFLTGAEKRAGVKYLKKDKRSFGFLNNIKVDENFSLHNVRTNIKLVEELLNKKSDEEPSLEFYLNDDDERFADFYLSELNINPLQLVVGFHPGSAVLKNHIKRRWEPEKFARLGKMLIEKNSAKILVFGGPDESELKNDIITRINSPEAIFVKTDNLAESAAVMKRCNVFVTNDSSLMHVASALKLKVVAVIGPTNQNFIHPWKTEHKIVSLNLECSPCFYYSPKPLKCYRNDVLFKCIKELDVDMVYKAVNELLNESGVFQR